MKFGMPKPSIPIRKLGLGMPKPNFHKGKLGFGMPKHRFPIKNWFWDAKTLFSYKRNWLS